MLPLIGLAILMALGIEFGLVLLIVPGVMLFVAWSVASPALVAERTGVFEAFGRSRFLTKGARWKVFGIEAILLIVYLIFASAFGATLYSVSGANLTTMAITALPISWIVTSIISGTIVNMVWSTMQTSLYIELRNWKEGLPEQTLEEIFA